MKQEIMYQAFTMFGYIWALVMIFSKQPFDGAVLLLMTFFFRSYRKAIQNEISKRRNK